MSTTEETGELLDSMPAVQAQALVSTESNPYMRMAEMAMTTGKVDQLEKLMELGQKWSDEQARKAFVAAMADFKTEAGGITISKSKLVSFKTSSGKTEYVHAELHDITRALVPVMAKFGLSHRWPLKQDASGITVSCVISHRDGHSESVSMTAPADSSGGKNAIQSIASTKTYLERYTLLAATGIATGGEADNDGASFYDEPELPAKDGAWIDAVNALTDYLAYLEMKKKMLADYGGKPDNIPNAVRDAFNRIAEATKPRD